MTDSCLWFDEIFSVHAAEHPWGSLFWFVAQDLIHPPFFYVVLKLWIALGGESLLWLRLFPVFFSTLALFPFLHLCKELKLKTSATIFALLFFTVNGALIKYGQEVRMYSMLLFLSLTSLWLFSRFYFRGKNIWILTLVNVLLIYTHYFGWFVIATEVVTIFIFQRVKIRHVLIMSGITLAAFAPWMFTVAKAAMAGAEVTQNIGWIPRPGLRSMIDFILDAVEPFYFQQSSAEPNSLLYIVVPLLLVIAVAKALFLLELKRNEDKSAVYLLSLFVLVPMLLAFAISWISPVSIWGSRHLIIVFAPVAILMGMFVSGIEQKTVRYIVVSVICVLILSALVMQIRLPQPHLVWCEFEPMGGELEADGRGPVYVFEDMAAYHLWFGFREKRNLKEWMQVIKLSGQPGMTEDRAYFLPRGFDDVLVREADKTQPEQGWFVYRARTLDVSTPPLREFLAQGYRLEDQKIRQADHINVVAVFLRKDPRMTR